ncbi:MAG: hypothetical protein K6F84_04570, partial [Lachnospiraceae bacterium]|nr:hypothetical protein [Lachnospiraceae bacterium]
MKHSLRRQFSLIFIGLMALSCFICVLMCNLFLEKVYLERKMTLIKKGYDNLCEALDRDKYGTDEFNTNLNEYCSKHDLGICLIDSESSLEYIYSNGRGDMEIS